MQSQKFFPVTVYTPEQAKEKTNMCKKYLKGFSENYKNSFFNEELNLIENIMNGMTTIIEQNASMNKQSIAQEYIGRNLFSILEFIKFDINGKNGIRKTSPIAADNLTHILNSYLQSMRELIGVKIINGHDLEVIPSYQSNTLKF